MLADYCPTIRKFCTKAVAVHLSPARTPTVDEGLLLSLQELPTQTAVAAEGERGTMSVVAIELRLRAKTAVAIVDSREGLLGGRPNCTRACWLAGSLVCRFAGVQLRRI